MILREDTIRFYDVTIDGVKSTVTVDVVLREDSKDRPTLSISGDISRHSSGQVCDTIEENIDGFAEKDRKRVKRIVSIWKKHHLNDMHAGTKLQEQVLRRREKEWEKSKEEYGYSHYNWAVHVLGEENMYEQDGYRYGSKWLYQPIPKTVLAEIKAGL